MSTEIDWAAIHAALIAPFPVGDVEFKPGRGANSKPLIYIDARAVQDRLDQAVGPGHWSFDWQPLILDNAVRVVKGVLTIHGISKADIGDGEAIEPNKAAVSDALKRCAVQWGVGRYLYGLGISSEQAYKDWYARQTGAARPPPPNGHAPPPLEARPVAVTDPRAQQLAAFRAEAKLKGKGKNWLLEVFGKGTPEELTDGEIADGRALLADLPTPAPTAR